MTDVLTILAAVADVGATLFLDDAGALKLDADPNAMPPSELLTTIRENRDALAKHLRGEPPAAAPPPAQQDALPARERAIVVTIMQGGRTIRADLEPAIMTGPPPPPRIETVCASDAIPTDLTPAEAHTWARRRLRMSNTQADEYAARLAFGDRDAWQAWRGG